MSPRVLSVILIVWIAGCEGFPRSASREGVSMNGAASNPPARRARYTPPPDRFVQSMLLNFESSYDASFVDARSVRWAIDGSNRVLQTTAANLKLGALVRGREFPGPWDLIGLRVKAVGSEGTAGSIRIRPAGSVADRSATFTARADGWTTHWFELAALGLPTAATGPTTAAADDLVLSVAAGAPVWIDDLAIAQSRTTVSESSVPRTGEAWRVQRVGLEWQASIAGQVVLRLPALPFVATGYQVIEAGPTRVLFATVDESSTVSIDRTGRLIEDGRARIDPAVMKYAKAVAENLSPARIEVVGDGAGRVERSLPGDRDNDGYDEVRGCYSVRAGGDRVTFRLSRQRATVRWPVVEVYDLPPGAVSVWIEGQTLAAPVRLADGRVVIELPIELERPVEVQVRVR